MVKEITLYEIQAKKMNELCEENNLVYRFDKDRYPITLTIRHDQGMHEQISMLEDDEGTGYRSKDADMTWIFQDGVLTTKVTGGTFTISKALRQKVENILLKMISFWQQYFFREIMDSGILPGSMLPQIHEETVTHKGIRNSRRRNKTR